MYCFITVVASRLNSSIEMENSIPDWMTLRQEVRTNCTSSSMPHSLPLILPKQFIGWAYPRKWEERSPCLILKQWITIPYCWKDLLTCKVSAHTLLKIKTMSKNSYYTAPWPLKSLTNHCYCVRGVNTPPLLLSPLLLPDPVVKVGGTHQYPLII